MKTTLNIDDDLYRQAKARAALTDSTVSRLVEVGLRMVMNEHAAARPRRTRVRLPIIPAKPGARKLFAGLSSEQLHQRLADLQAQADLHSHDSSPGR